MVQLLNLGPNVAAAAQRNTRALNAKRGALYALEGWLIPILGPFPVAELCSTGTLGREGPRL